MRLPGLTYANVVSTIALFLALGGVSYAAVKLSPNSVRSTTIKNGQVKAVDLAGGAVTSAKIRDGSILAKDIRAGALPGIVTGTGAAGGTGGTGAAGASGAAGAQGPAGPAGPAGPQGPAGVNGTSGADGATGPAGAAVLPAAFTPSATVTAGANVGAFGGNATIAWQQPPGAVDEIRGVVRLNYPAECTDAGSGLAFMALDESNREISIEAPTDDKPNANGPHPVGVGITAVQFLMGEEIDAAVTDFIGLPIEDNVFRNTGATTLNRSVRISLARVGAGCTLSPTANLSEVYVVRSTP